MKIRVRYETQYNKKNQPFLRAYVQCTDEGDDYRFVAEDYIMTGYWGWLAEETNQHLVKYRDRYLAKVAELGYTTNILFCGWGNDD